MGEIVAEVDDVGGDGLDGLDKGLLLMKEEKETCVMGREWPWHVKGTVLVDGLAS